MSYFFFFNDTATTEIYTLSLHDALPILPPEEPTEELVKEVAIRSYHSAPVRRVLDRKSTRLNSSHLVISYAVFCLKKKNQLQLTSSTRRSIETPRCRSQVTSANP